MCLSKRSELRHIDPKARIERWDNLNSLSKQSELRTLIPNRKQSDGIPLIALASQGASEFLRIKEF